MKSLSFLCLVAGIASASSHNLRNENRVAILDHPAQEFSSWIDVPDDVLQEWMGEDTATANEPHHVMKSINKFRAKICYQMKEANGHTFDSFTKCKDFMEKACRPGKDQMMDGDQQEISSGKGYCKMYFPETDEELQKEIKDMEDAEAGRKEASQHAKAEKKQTDGQNAEAMDAGKAEDTIVEKSESSTKQAGGAGDDKKGGVGEEGSSAEKARKAGGGAGDAGNGKGSGADGKGGADEGDADEGGGKWPAGEAWYYKKDGKHPDRFHMSGEKKLPEHGFWGPLVKHTDKKTSSSDWQAEFGVSDDKTLAAVCKEHPENEWCHEKGYKPSAPPAENSATASLKLSAAIGLTLSVVAAVVLCSQMPA